MGNSRLVSVLAAVTIAAGFSAVGAPTASAKTVKDDGVKDCMKQAKPSGVKKSDAKTACSYAKGGDVADCISLYRNDSKGGDLIGAESGCRKAGPKHG